MSGTRMNVSREKSFAAAEDEVPGSLVLLLKGPVFFVRGG